jgi:hypothetical protein
MNVGNTVKDLTSNPSILVLKIWKFSGLVQPTGEIAYLGMSKMIALVEIS